MWIILSPIFLLFFQIEKGIFFQHNKSHKKGKAMRILQKRDYLQVIKASLIADYDRLTITNLYAPIIGMEAMALYFCFWGESENQKITPIISHEQFFLKNGISASTFIAARKILEGSGLLRTYVSENGDSSVYRYELYAPKTPSAFFNDVLLTGVLINEIGLENVEKLKKIYLFNPQKNNSEKEITASFIEVFNPDFNSDSFKNALNGGNASLIGRQKGRIDKEFSYEQFFVELSAISQIKQDAFTKKDMKEIARLAALYGANENTTAIIVEKNYLPAKKKGEHLDYNDLARSFMEETSFALKQTRRKSSKKNMVSSNSDLGQKINLIESVSPREYLAILQNNTNPGLPDLLLINNLSKNFNLPNAVINALIDYVLTINNNVLSKAYCEKIAGALARENVQTGVDAMQYLSKVYKATHGKDNKKKTYTKTTEKEETKPVPEAKKETKVEDDISWDDLMDSVFGKED